MRARNAPLRNRRDINSINIGDSDDDDAISSITNQRIRRETPECVSNYNSVRQLWIGCSMPDVIEVKPQCEQNKDEEGKKSNKFSLFLFKWNKKVFFGNQKIVYFALTAMPNVNWRYCF